MSYTLKNLWKRWVIRHCKRNYPQSVLPRRVPHYKNRHGPMTNPTCEFLRGFYCISDSFLATVFLMMLFVVILLFLCGFTISDLKYQIGGESSAVISISTLDLMDDINYPEDAAGHDHNEDNHSNSSKHLLYDDELTFWKVDGYTKYIEEFANDPDILGRFGKLPSGKNLDRKGYGFWVFKFDPSRSHDRSNSSTTNGIPSIRALKITDSIRISLNEVEVAVAIRAYVDGEATFVVKYENTLLKSVHTEHIKNEEFKNKGFCYKILEIPFDKQIDAIHIRPISTNLRRHGIVILDQVLVVIAKRDVTENVMHTLVPSNWC